MKQLAAMLGVSTERRAREKRSRHEVATSVNEVNAMMRSQRITAADADALVTMVNRIIRSISL